MYSIIVSVKFEIPRLHNNDEFSLYETESNKDEGFDNEEYKEYITIPEIIDIKIKNRLLDEVEKKLNLLIRWVEETDTNNYPGKVNIERFVSLQDEADVWFRITRDTYNEQNYEWFVDDFNNWFSELDNENGRAYIEMLLGSYTNIVKTYIIL
jgi:hypothetical protein